MEVTVMVWSSGNARESSIYGILDKAKPGKLPVISDKAGVSRRGLSRTNVAGAQKGEIGCRPES
jgi:hypothetical protein